ncbi:MAG: hypothetical protein ACXVB0_21645 [Mucilaginibacter sp.]
MKKLLLILLLPVLFSQRSSAQADHVPGPAEKKLTDSLCAALGRLDLSKIGSGKDAEDAFMNCFMQQSSMFESVATERKVAMDDDVAMHQIGVDIGKNLLKEKCDAFLKLAMKIAEKSKSNGDESSGSTYGTFKRIDNKGFNYIAVTDAGGNERSFLWLRQFSGSGKFTNGAADLAGKKLKIGWKELEVYLPQAKGYYKVKEIVSIEVQ